MAAHQEAAQTIQMLFWAQVWLIHDKLQQCRIVLLTLTRARKRVNALPSEGSLFHS